MLRIFNSLSNKIEDFKPLKPPNVGVYTCGPTVYDFVHIGNLRTYTTADFLIRTLNYLGFKTKYIINITDVGHLTGDNLGDADIGEDRMEKAAQKEKKTAWDIAAFYTEQFFKDFKKLNLLEPLKFTKATDHIQEQITLVKKLEEKGFTYKTSDGIYFDTQKFPNYGQLSTLDKKGITPGKRVDMREKKSPTDFALWKFTPKGEQRQMEWESSWGKGFPGWHIECSAMSMKYLGESFDLHLGGEDLRSTHHPNEIAQSEAVTGKPFVKYWLHGAFMQIEGQRMSKSLKNNFRLVDLEKKGFTAMDLRYLYFTVHYRKQMNFTFQALEGARNAYQNLNNQLLEFKQDKKRTELSEEKLAKIDDFEKRFQEAIEDDLNLPQALSIVWEVVKSSIPSTDKYDLIMSFNEVFGLTFAEEKITIPQNIQDLAQKRWEARKQGKYEEADILRTEIEKRGYRIEDKKGGVRVVVSKL